MLTSTAPLFNSSFEYEDYDERKDPLADGHDSSIAILVVLGVIGFVGVVGNVLVPIVILKCSDLRTSTNVFLINLAIADCLFILICMPPAVVEMYTERGHVWIFGSLMCRIVPYAELTTAHVSSVTLVTVGLERYIAVCRPLQAGSTCTRKRAAYLCLGSWLVSSAAASPMIFISVFSVEHLNGEEVTACFTMTDEVWKQIFFILSVVVFFFIPLLILIIVYWLIARYLILDKQTMRRLRGSSRSVTTAARTRTRIIYMLGVIVVCFFVCLLPFRIIIIWVTIGDPFSHLSERVFLLVVNIARVMSYVNSVINPILYNVMSSKFRDGFLRLLGVRSALTRQGTFITSSTATSSRQRTATGQPSNLPSEAS